jgi:putative iron-dependent peroxidase
LRAIPAQARYLNFNQSEQSNAENVIQSIESLQIDNTVVGLGQSLLDKLNKKVPGMKSMPAMAAPNIDIPSISEDLWIWIGGDDRGELLHRSRQLIKQLAPAFTLSGITDAFRYVDERDLTGYIDGTENPQDEEATNAAIASGVDVKVDGSSFVAVQRWLHNLDQFESFDRQHQDNIFGRHRDNNEEFDEAPKSAHVKRTAQESFDPEAFVLRRSMPWSNGLDSGLVFVAFGKSFYSFEALLGRMIGNEDNITDGLFEFSKPVTGAYFWCPPVSNGALSLIALKD